VINPIDTINATGKQIIINVIYSYHSRLSTKSLKMRRCRISCSSIKIYPTKLIMIPKRSNWSRIPHSNYNSWFNSCSDSRKWKPMAMVWRSRLLSILLVMKTSWKIYRIVSITLMRKISCSNKKSIAKWTRIWLIRSWIASSTIWLMMCSVAIRKTSSNMKAMKSKVNRMTRFSLIICSEILIILNNRVVNQNQKKIKSRRMKSSSKSTRKSISTISKTCWRNKYSFWSSKTPAMIQL